MSCLRPLFKVFFKSRKRLSKVPAEKLAPDLPAERRPSAGNHALSRNFVFVLLKISVVPMEEGSRRFTLDNSKSPGVLAPPPIKTTPAGKRSDRFIFLK